MNPEMNETIDYETFQSIVDIADPNQPIKKSLKLLQKSL